MATTKVSGELVDLNESTSDSGLKIPTGTNNNRPATDVAGMIRNNTNEASEGSASCEEYYSGSAWKKINNVALPPDFKNIAYTGNGGTQSITGIGFKPDFVWIKSTSGNTYSHAWTDSTRGVNSQIYSNDSTAATNLVNVVTSFDADGFSLGSGLGGNANGANYLAFCWKANGGTTSSNTDGSTTSTVQANQNVGFSIVKYTGTGSNASIGHGLSAAPEIIFIKKLTGSSDWVAGALDWTKYLEPNGTPPFRTSNVWQDTAPTNSVFTLTTGGDSNGNGQDYIAYCFHSASGYSKFGTYAGTGSSNSITGLGFQPSWVLIKSTTSTENWPIFSSSLADNYIVVNTGATAQAFTFPFDSDGFTVPAASGMTNGSGQTYIYLAFK